MSEPTPERVCMVEDCTRGILAKDYCGRHYQRNRIYGDPNYTLHPGRPDAPRFSPGQGPDECLVEDCTGQPRGRGYCSKHYGRVLKTGITDDPPPPKVCGREGCERKYSSRGYCQRHLVRVLNDGDPGPIGLRPRKVPGPHEYIFISVNGKQMMEHRHVMAQMIGRKLTRTENVHHKNGDKHDNRPQNLELWITSQPPGQRIPDRVAHAIEVLTLYAPAALSLDYVPEPVGDN